MGKPVVGKQQATHDVVKTFVDAVPDLRWEMTSKPVYNGDTIAFQWRFTGINDGAWAGTPATHKKSVLMVSALFVSRREKSFIKAIIMTLKS
ncbi:ester cyclase [Rosenbergiella australiborealis]|uniref:ester cyclase n=1 Tax=Rosenbergiella australiborealis TaxID=1544696 RepID=UPI0030B8D4D8